MHTVPFLTDTSTDSPFTKLAFMAFMASLLYVGW